MGGGGCFFGTWWHPGARSGREDADAAGAHGSKKNEDDEIEELVPVLLLDEEADGEQRGPPNEGKAHPVPVDGGTQARAFFLLGLGHHHLLVRPEEEELGALRKPKDFHGHEARHA